VALPIRLNFKCNPLPKICIEARRASHRVTQDGIRHQIRKGVQRFDPCHSKDSTSSRGNA
ncbi:hypothetical protein ACC699_39790, partial [Rhizobium ruizarguesonis]